MIADSPMRMPAVPAVPISGNSPFAKAAPPWTLTTDKITAGTGRVQHHTDVDARPLPLEDGVDEGLVGEGELFDQ